MMTCGVTRMMQVIQPQNSGRRTCLGVAGALLALGVVSFAVWRLSSVSSDALLALAHKALTEGRFNDAEEYSRRVLDQEPTSRQALLIAGEAAGREQRVAEAIDYFEQIPDDGSAEAVRARCTAGEFVLRQIGDLPQAERLFRRAWEQDPNSPPANHYLAYLVGLSDGGWAATPYRVAQIRSGQFSELHLLALARSAAVVEQPELLERYRKTDPANPQVMTARARQLIQQEQQQAAMALLQEAVQQPGHSLGARVELGRLLLQSGDVPQFLEWHAHLPSQADERPEIWLVRGEFARTQQSPEVAARCLWEAVLRDPHQPGANYQLGQVLVALNRPDAAAGFLRRAREFEAYLKTLDATTRAVTESTQKAAELAESLGLQYEAYGWSRWALMQQPRIPWAIEMANRLESQLNKLGDARGLPEHNPALLVDLSDYPLPNWAHAPSVRPRTVVDQEESDRIRFSDDAREAGIAFAYFNGGDPRHGMRMLYEFTGGGVAVVDFDVDGWPDLHLTQGCRWPVRRESTEHLDRLFRNLGNGRFVDVTGAARLIEAEFSQGVAAGDFDSDGFPDLYIGNIGGNRFYHNNGDGTFTDITEQTVTAGNDWTTSCAIADLNGDAQPDVYVVNYLGGEDVFTRVCGNETGRSLCLPQYFSGAQDRLYLNRGDGTFEDITDTSGIVAPDGRGLGVVVGDFSSDGGLEAFIANDLAPNFFFVNQQTERGGRPVFSEEALLRGLAVNGNGQFEACMGVAAGDANDDGLCDLFVTNFELETNTLYQQASGLTFVDATQSSGLAEPSRPMLGFGTQFLDADLDGDLDLIVANGHIDDGRSMGRPYQMPPQFFENVGRGRFVELKGPGLGAYFQGTYLGRGLARLDWNRDGREDFVVSHLDHPLSLLTNATVPAGRFVKLRLAGTRSERRATGAVATLVVGSRTIVRHLTAGDGYHASNEPVLTFGLGTGDDPIVSLEIHWPAGGVQTVDGVRPNSEWLIIEGRSSAIELPPAR